MLKIHSLEGTCFCIQLSINPSGDQEMLNCLPVQGTRWLSQWVHCNLPLQPQRDPSQPHRSHQDPHAGPSIMPGGGSTEGKKIESEDY